MSVTQAISGLAAKVLEGERADREKARHRYPALLEQQAPDANAIAELRAAMRLLGKGPAALEADVATLAKYRQWHALFSQGRGLGDELHTAQLAIEAHHKETQRIHAERVEQLQELGRAKSDLEARRNQADQAMKDMNALRVAHADLLMHERELSPDDLAKPRPMREP